MKSLGRWHSIRVSRMGGDQSCLLAIAFNDITERKLKEAALRENDECQAFLLKLSDALRPLTDPLHIQAKAARMLGEHLGIASVGFCEVGKDGDTYTAGGEYGGGRMPGLEGWRARLLDHGPGFGPGLRAGETVSYADIRMDPKTHPDGSAETTALNLVAGAAVPLMKNGRLVAYSYFAHPEPHPWPEHELHLLGDVAERTWAAVERARAEAALRDSEALARALIANLPSAAAFVVDAGLRYRLAGGEALEAAGFNAEAFIGRRLDEVLPPELAQEYAPCYRQALAGETFGHEHAAHGRVYLTRGVPLRNEGGGDVYAALAVSYDITERRRAEQALRASEEKYRALFTTMNQGFCLIEKIQTAAGKPSDFRYVAANPAFERHTGLRDPVGKTIREFVPASEPSIMDRYDRVVQTGKPDRFEAYVAALDLWMDAEAFPTQAPGQIAVLFSNIVERKRAEQALRETEERQAFLLNLSDALRPLSDTAEIQGAACRLLGERLQANHACYVDIHEAEDFAFVERDYARDGVPSLARRYRLSAFRWVIPLYKLGQPVIVADLRTSPLVPEPDRAAMMTAQIIAWIAIPLVKRGELVGALCVAEGKPREWADLEIDLACETAERIWAAIERAQAEKALRESEERQRILLEGMPQLVWRSHHNGQWTWSSPQWRHFTSQSQEESLGTGWLNAVHPDDREPIRRAWAMAAERELLDVEYRVRRASDRAYVWHHTRAVPVRNGQDEVLEWLGTSTDIEDLKQAEAARREAEERFRLFVENVQEYALVQTNAEGLIASWNPGAQRLFQYTAEQMLGRNFSSLLTPEDFQTGLFRKELAMVAGGQRNEDARWFVRQDGSRFWARWITEPMLDQTGQFRGLAKIMRDETERQHAADVVQQSLFEKEELLKEVHHRVKNNLQVIVSLLNMQTFQIRDERVLALFQETRNRVMAISSIHELLYRAESFAGIRLSDYARQLAPGLVRFYGLEQRVEVKVLGDGTRLELERGVPYGMLLNELVSNACKHAFPLPQTGIITISILPDGKDIELVIADTGGGLPDGFNYQKTSSLGLKLVHGLVRQLRGALEFQSNPGTTVKVRFPATATENEE